MKRDDIMDKLEDLQTFAWNSNTGVNESDLHLRELITDLIMDEKNKSWNEALHWAAENAKCNRCSHIVTPSDINKQSILKGLKQTDSNETMS